MKRIILILLAVFSCYIANCQKDTTDLTYRSIRQVYRGAYTKSALMTDSQYYETTKSSFRYNKPIYVQGKLLGGETLGNPSTSGMLLKSTTDGVRSWGWADRVKNYNTSADTIIRMSTISANKFGIWGNINAGNFVLFNSNTGVFAKITSSSGTLIEVASSTGNIGNFGTHTGNGIFYSNLSGTGFSALYSGGTTFYSLGSTSLYKGIEALCTDSVSLTSGALSAKFGKSNYYSAFDGFGRWNYYKSGVRLARRDTLGMEHGEIPSATGFDTTVNLSVNLTADVWQKVTNSTNNLWSLSNTASYMTFSADTIKNTYAGKYEYSFSLSVNGKDAATYEYRVMKKTGTTVSVIRKIKITGGGVNVERIINCAPLLAAGDRVWLEVRFIGSPTGSPISIFGSYFTAKAVYLSL